MRKILIVLLSTLISFTTLTVNIAADEYEEPQVVEEIKQEDTTIPDTVVVEEEKATEVVEITPKTKSEEEVEKTTEEITEVVEIEEQIIEEETPEIVVEEETAVEEEEEEIIEVVEIQEQVTPEEEVVVQEQPTENKETKEETVTKQETKQETIEETKSQDFLSDVKEGFSTQNKLMASLSSPLMAFPTLGKGNTHTLTFDPNGGTVTPTTKEISNGTEIGELPTPTNEGHNFLGWFTSKEGGKEVTSSSKFNNDTVIFAHWETIAANYTVTIDLDDGTVDKAPDDWTGSGDTYTKVFAGGTSIVDIVDEWSSATITKESKKFNGWDVTTGSLSSATTITAQYIDASATTYTVTFDLAGGTATAPSGWSGSAGTYTKDFEEGTLISTIIADWNGITPTKTNYEFASWSYTDTTTLTGALSVTATYTESVGNLDINKAETNCKINCASKANQNSEVTFTVIPNEEYEITFIKVVNDNNSKEITYTATGNTNEYKFTMPNKSVTITATASLKTYSITKDVDEYVEINIADDLTTAAKGTEVTFTLKLDDYCSLTDRYPTVTSPVELTEDKGTYSFTMPGNAVTITAKAAINTHVVTIDLASGSIDTPIGWVLNDNVYTKTINEGTSISDIVTDFSLATKEGYALTGWSISTGILENDITITAQWLKLFTVTYKANNGGDAFAEHSGLKEPHTVLANTFTNGEKLFTYWSENQDGTGSRYEVGSEITEDTTLWAQWADKVTITYNGNDADTGSVPADQVVAKGSDVSILGNEDGLTKAGKLFAYWVDGAGEIYKPGKVYTITGDLELSAYWADPVTITYKANGATGGTVPTTQTVALDSTFAIASNSGNLVKEGYYFAGWCEDFEGKGEIYLVGEAVTATGDMTLYAVWSDSFTTIRYYANNGKGEYYETDKNVPKIEAYTLLEDNTTTNFEYADHIFIGWGYAEDSINPIKTINTITRTKVYAIWAETCTFKYHENVAGTEKTFTVENVPEIRNYEIRRDNCDGFNGGTFAGWGITSDATNPVITVDTTQYHDVYAIWQGKKEYVAKFYSYTEYNEEGGVLIENPTPIFSVAKIKGPAKGSEPILVNVDYEKINSDFNLFNKKGEFVGTFLQIKGQHTTEALTPDENDDLSVYVNYLKGENIIDILVDLRGDYLIKYYDSDGSEITKLRTVVDESEKGNVTLATASDVTAAGVERDGFNFEGWYTEPSYINKKTTTSFAEKGVKEFYAKWEPVPGEEKEGNIETIDVEVTDVEIKDTVKVVTVEEPTVAEMEHILGLTGNKWLIKEYEQLGETIDIWVEVTHTNTTSGIYNEMLSRIEGEGGIDPVFFDAELFVGHHDGTNYPIHEPGCMITVSVIMSAEAVEKVYKEGEDREYWLLRSHIDGESVEYDKIPVISITKIEEGANQGDYIVTFETDKFSTYALYATSETPVIHRHHRIPKTGVDAVGTLTIDAYPTMTILSSALYAIICEIREKKEKFSKKNKK